MSKDKTVSLGTGAPREGHPRENEGAPGELKDNGQHSDYWVLSVEERNKGFVRPLRRSYIHAGKRPTYSTRPLTEEEQTRYEGNNYVAYEKYPEEESPLVGMFWTQKQLDSGCDSVTTMSTPIAETYARDPKFYGSTFCVSCGAHFPVDEFVWRDNPTQKLGS